MGSVSYYEFNNNIAFLEQRLADIQKFKWLFDWGMYLFLLVAIAVLTWVFFDSVNKHKDQQALVPRILSMVGFFLVIPAFIFRFTGNADGISVQVLMKAEVPPAVYPGPVNWNVNWLMRGYGSLIAIVALLGMVLSAVAMVIYASTLQRAKPSTEFVQAFNSQMSSLERKVDDVSRAQAHAPAAPLPLSSTPIMPNASSAGVSDDGVPSTATIIDRKPQAATIIDVPRSGDTLTVRMGSGRGNIYDLPEDDVTVGRDSSCYIVVDDGKVSGKHLKLTYDGTTWAVFDLGSTNGSYLNGSRLRGQQQLADGDEIRVGDTTLVFGSRRQEPAQN